MLHVSSEKKRYIFKFFYRLPVFIFLCYREVWPERNEFGTADISPEDEFMALREIFMTSLPSKFSLLAHVNIGIYS